VSGKKLSRPMAIGLIVAGDLLVLVLGWMLLVGPQRSATASIAKQTQVAEAEIVQAQKDQSARSQASQPKQPAIRTAGLYELAKAMPTTTDMPDVMLEIDQIARDSGVDVTSITPGIPVLAPNEPYSTVSISLVVIGNYYDLTDLLYRLRTLVAVEDGAFAASGRLFAVQEVSFTPVQGGTSLNGTITVNAYVYGTPGSTADTTTIPTTTTSTDSTSTGTTTTTTATSASSDAAP
jgi:Tfp pilus assembly protein PilO